MSLWTSRGQVCIHGAFPPKSCGQGGERAINFLLRKVTDLHKYKNLIVGKKFFSKLFLSNNSRPVSINRIRPVNINYMTQAETIFKKNFLSRILPTFFSFVGAIIVSYILFNFPFSLGINFIWDTDGLLAQAQIQSIIDSGVFGLTNNLGYPFGFTQWNNPEISYLHGFAIWILSKLFSISTYGYMTFIAFSSVFLNSLFMFSLAKNLFKNSFFCFIFLFLGLLLPFSLYSIGHPHVITVYMYIALLVLLVNLDSLNNLSLIIFLIVLLSTNMFQLINLSFILSILVAVYFFSYLLNKGIWPQFKNLLKIYVSTIFVFSVNFLNYAIHSSINGQNGRNAYQSDIFAGKLTDLLLSSPYFTRYLPNLETLQSGISGELRLIGLPLVISIFFGIVFILIYPNLSITDNGIKVITTLFVITLLTFITGGFGNLQASFFVLLGEISPMRSWSRLSVFLGFISLVLLVFFLRSRINAKQMNLFALLLLLLAILDFTKIPRDSKFEANDEKLEESGFINFINTNFKPCPVLQLPVDTYFIPQSAVDRGWRYYWNGMIPYVILPEFSWTAATYVDSPGWEVLTNIPNEIDEESLKKIGTEYCAIVFDKNFSQYQIDRKAGLNMTQGQWPGLRMSNSLLPEYEDTRYAVYTIK